LRARIVSSLISGFIPKGFIGAGISRVTVYPGLLRFLRRTTAVSVVPQGLAGVIIDGEESFTGRMASDCEAGGSIAAAGTFFAQFALYPFTLLDTVLQLIHFMGQHIPPVSLSENITVLVHLQIDFGRAIIFKL
jgi:hypothetical protein